MLYIILTILLCFLGVFTFIPKFKSVIERYSVGINFFLTLVATLVGVLLAISITNYEAKQIGWMSAFGKKLCLPLEGSDSTLCEDTNIVYRLVDGTVHKDSIDD